MIEGFDIICFSTADWDTALPTNKHQLMTRLARRNRVVFIETLGTRRVNWSSGADTGRIARRVKRLLAGMRRVPESQWPTGREEIGGAQARSPGNGGGLWVLSPCVLPRWENPLISLGNRAALGVQLHRVSQWLGPGREVRAGDFAPSGSAGAGGRAGNRRGGSGARPRIVWCYSPHAVNFLAPLRPATVVYHAVDDLAAVPGAESGALRSAERRLMKTSDHVICTVEPLLRRAQRHHATPHWMENVADYEHFSRGDAAALPGDLRALHAKLAQKPAPRLVFSGHLAGHKVDFALLRRLRELRPAWSLVLMGPEWEGAEIPADLQALRGDSGVVFTGRIPYEHLPPFLHLADVLLIPYRDTPATKFVSPLKFYEYLATGRPIVATPLPSIVRYGEVAAIVEGAEAFVASVERALAQPPEAAATARELRLALARRFTWDYRLEEIERVLRDGAKP